ncbi:peptidase M35 [Pseudoalteromonas sp. SCSIO 43201]|uniref:Peptidyl-Lys metalloendopeptidase n=1 Tax=Pseudoalteromonas peptidolytica F12-50-A1 TaxID=1315280 RepID=A0A8I0MUJ3_9GAMM|nr:MULTISPECIES: M35 family metallo-endopeptidase [Pseudoalteromonas]MBE0345612.1 peptidyl-Lys metalloendopeptidase [Pseudoalteromonas peptidolytica F12-50-A1]NLR13546.1 peptidase M35 [Pseudoalteromonas peptidolytica]USD27677.1 peptidase M35 [Pseudoalteromonas sp. SCSIO 43201]GEK10276.1 peptidase M35 [Pseudoalteromonas peptidolytica]
MKLLSRTVSAGLLATAISASLHANAMNENLLVSVDVDTKKNGDVIATLNITNQGKDNQKILSWYTDLDEEHIFKITRDGKEVDFFGPHYKRHAPTEEDFIKLKSGETLSKSFELSGLYDLSKPGNYEISYDVESFDLFGRNDKLRMESRMMQHQSSVTSSVAELSSNAVNLWLEGVPLSKGNIQAAAKPGAAADCTDGTCFTGRCSNSEKNSILSALDAADQITNNSVAYLNSHSANNPSTRYNTWFGSATSSRYATVKANFNAINDAIDNQDLTFDCSCNQSYFAYVYPNQPYKIYLCRAFWNANELGTDSRAGTIVHELSHFNVVAGTDDIVYGQSGAKSLAISNPSQAIQNADSHEYFAENTPYQN